MSAVRCTLSSAGAAIWYLGFVALAVIGDRFGVTSIDGPR